MESSWSRNVADYGLGSLGATLAARLPTTFRYVMNVTRPDFPGYHIEAEILLDIDAPITFSIVPNVGGHNHFPYGIPVEPDIPL